jgi:hypothetical protein
VLATSSKESLAAIEFVVATIPVMNDAPAPPSATALPAEARVASAEPAGADVTRTVTVNVSIAASIGAVMLTGILIVEPTAEAGIVPTVTAVGVIAPFALAGATDVTTPRPKAATATSAMRLKVVFVDICFLSISRDQEFPGLGFG